MFEDTVELIRAVKDRGSASDPIPQIHLHEVESEVQFPARELCSAFKGFDVDQHLGKIIIAAYNFNRPKEQQVALSSLLHPGVNSGENSLGLRVLGTQRRSNLIAYLDHGIYLVDSGVKGQTTFVQGGVHGNELCGVAAISNVLRDIALGRLSLIGGKCIFALGNEEALRAEKRSIRFNQNRQYLIQKDEKGRLIRPQARYGYESTRPYSILRWVEHSGLVLDLHSTTLPTPSFGWIAKQDKEYAIALGTPYVVCYEPTEPLKILNRSSGANSLNVLDGTFSEAARLLGKKGITIECGSHYSSEALMNADLYMARFLQDAGCIDDDTFEQLCNRWPSAQSDVLSTELPVMLDVVGIYLKHSEEIKWTKPRKSLEFIKKGELLLTIGSREYRAPSDGYLILPTPVENQKIGEELFMFAVKSS